MSILGASMPTLLEHVPGEKQKRKMNALSSRRATNAVRARGRREMEEQEEHSHLCASTASRERSRRQMEEEEADDKWKRKKCALAACCQCCQGEKQTRNGRGIEHSSRLAVDAARKRSRREMEDEEEHSRALAANAAREIT